MQLSELKRINNIHKENEIFARRSLKVPVQPFSIFTETNNEPESIASTSNNEQVINVLLNPISHTSTADINNVILNSVCEPISTDNVCTNIHDNDESEELLRSSDRDSTPEGRVVDSFRCSGADWGLSWAHLLGLSIFLGIVLPVIYIFHIAESHHVNQSMVNTTVKEHLIPLSIE